MVAVQIRECPLSFDVEEQITGCNRIAARIEEHIPAEFKWVIRAWRAIYREKARHYGTSAWSINGLAGIFGSISAKHYRIIGSPTHWNYDAFRDIFGYMVLALFFLSHFDVNDEEIVHIIKSTKVMPSQRAFHILRHTLWNREVEEATTVASMLIQYVMSIFSEFGGRFSGRVAIVIPTYMRSEMVGNCIKSLPAEYRKYVVYNYDRPQDVEEIVNIKNIVLCPTDGRGAGVMADGATVALGDAGGCDYLVFANDDCVFAHGAIEALIEPFMVDTTSAFGVIGVLDGWREHYDNLSVMPEVFVRPYTGVAWATPTVLYGLVGGIDREQMLGEDLDYQLRVRIAGYQIGVSQKSDAQHFWGSDGGLTESGVWRGEARRKVGRVWICRRIGSKIPGVLTLNDKYDWVINDGVIEMYHEMYRDKTISLSSSGIVWPER